MGGLGPGIGGFEILVIGLVALLVVGPKDLPVLMKRVGQFMARMRSMANEFRASFDDMARQSELDDLRKEVAALRTGQGMHPLGPDAEAAFKDISADLGQPLLTGRSEWPDAEPVMTPLPAPSVETPKAPAKARRKPASAKTATKPGVAVKTAKARPAVKPKSVAKAKPAARKTPRKAGT